MLIKLQVCWHSKFLFSNGDGSLNYEDFNFLHSLLKCERLNHYYKNKFFSIKLLLESSKMALHQICKNVKVS